MGTGGATLSGDTSPGAHTFYFHSTSPSGTVEEAANFGAGTGAPVMDETAPGVGAPKASGTETALYFTGTSSPNFAYWDGAVHANVSGLVATLYVSSPVGQSVLVEAFGDDAPIADGTVDVAAGEGVYTVPLAGHVSPVDASLRVRASLVFGGAVLYDSSVTPSSLTFDAAPYGAAPVGGSGGSSLPRTPAAGWGPVTLANDTLANRETSLAIDPTSDSRLFMCSPTGVPQTSYGHSLFMLSNDGGSQWSEVQVEQKATDTREYAFEGGDCDVAFDAAGTMYTADTWLGDLSIGHSLDHGATWDGTALSGTSPVVDRPWLVGGPDGTLHVTWQDVQFGMPTAVWYTRSTDHGQTFLPAVPVTDSKVTGAFSWEGNLVVAPGGHDMYLVYTTRVDPAYLTGSSEGVWVAASHDDGLTWTQNQVTQTPDTASYLYPSIGLDAAGGLHVVYASNDTQDSPTWYAYSSDKGVSWTSPVKVMADTGAFAPWVVGDGAGQCAILWYGVDHDFPSQDREQDWYLYAVRESGANVGAATFTGGKTTTTPIFTGAQTMPEFNQLRLDSQDRIHIGASAFVKDANGNVRWAEFHQAEL